MKLLVLRHDLAEPREAGAGPDIDAKRALTDADRALWLGYADQCRAKTLPLPDLDGAI